MMNNPKRLVVAVAFGASLAFGCYHLEGLSTVLGSAPYWTGAGHASVANATFGGHAVGLAGEDVVVFRGTSVSTYDSPLLAELGPGYTLTGIAQTHSLGHHENTFLHANPAGETGALDLFLNAGFHFHSTQRVAGNMPWFIHDDEIYEINRICDLAASELPEFGNPADDDSHLFLSVQACPFGSTTGCVGGVVEADFSTNSREWWVKYSGGYQAAIRRPNGALFSAECMPISATGLGGSNRHYVAVGDPSQDELLLFAVGALHQPAVSSRRSARSNQHIADLVLEGRGSGTTDFGFLTVLWTGTGGTRLEHTLATNGTLAASPFLTEAVSSTSRFIHTTGAGGNPYGGRADLYTFGSSVVRRSYVED